MMNFLDVLEDYPSLCFENEGLVFDTFECKVFNTSHDAPGSRGYIFKEDKSSLVYITDTGYINQEEMKDIYLIIKLLFI